MHNRGLPLLFASVLCLTPLGGCTRAIDPWAGTCADQKKVIATIAPIYCFAANVAGDKARVACLLTGKGPHDYDANDVDAAKVAGADLFLINGLELDDVFADKLRRGKKKVVTEDKKDAAKPGEGEDAKKKPEEKVEYVKTPPIVEVGEEIPHKLLIHPAHDEAHEKDAGHKHEHGEHDPHIWLGLPQARAMVTAIAKKLGEEDKDHAADFKANAEKYNEELTKLEEYGKKAFEGKTNRAFLSTHESLAYFSKTFGLDYVDSMQPAPGIEADANKLGKLVELCKTKKIGVIAVEPQYSRNQAERLAQAVPPRGADIKIVEIDPMETCVPGPNGNPDPKLYLERMKKNIDNLAGALP